MAFLFHLTGGHPEMAVAEVSSLAGTQKIMRFSADLVAVPKQVAGVGARLAYARAGYDLVLVSNEKDLVVNIKTVPWRSLVHAPLAVRFAGARRLEQELSAAILSILKNPSVSLERPRTLIEFFQAGDRVLCGIKVWENPGGFDQRRSHLLPAPHPSGMHPRLARWFVNMTGIRRGMLVDPFCGAGGILIEAGLMGLKPVGYDVVPSMVERAKRNLSWFNLAAQVKVRDALSIDQPLRFVATDLPYGRATRAGALHPLYRGFLEVLEQHLTGRAVIGFPHTVDLASMARAKKLRIAGLFEYALHRSLTKKIMVVEPAIH